MFFIKVFKNMFFYVFLYFMFFCAFLISCFCCCYNINVQNYKYYAFLLSKLRLLTVLLT